MDDIALTLEPQAVEALRKTRPWMYFLAVITVIVAVVMLCMLIAGLISLASHPTKASFLIGGGIGGLIISIPVAIAQFGYAAALSTVEREEGAELIRAIESACSRQRTLWIVSALVTGLGALIALLRILALLLF